MRIARQETDSEAYAKGLLTPWVRAMSHLSFTGAILSREDELTNDLLAEVETDLREALLHLDERMTTDDQSSFIGPDTISISENIYAELREFIDLDITNVEATDANRLDILNNIQNLMHNIANLTAKAENELWGIASRPGQLL